MRGMKMGQSLLRGLQIYFYMALVSIKAQFEYRYAFVMNILGWAMTYAGTAITMWVLLSSFGSIQGWLFWELLFLFALSVLSWSIAVIFFFHFRTLDQYVIQGTFDRFLLRPIHPFLHIVAMKFDVGAFGQLFFSIVALTIAYQKLALDWHFLQWLVFCGALLGGILIQGGILVAISAAAFWITRSERLFWAIMWPAKNLMNYPLTVFPGAVRVFVTFILPFAFVNYLPALLLLDKGSTGYNPVWGFFSFPVGLVFFAACFFFWQRGLNRYQSAGS